SFVAGDAASAERFESVVGGAFDRVTERFPGRRIRAFGEMVDVLCARGDAGAAAELEGLWNDLGRTRRFALLCGYHLDVFDPEAQSQLLPVVCRAHTHVRPAYSVRHLSNAVDEALGEVLGKTQ